MMRPASPPCDHPLGRGLAAEPGAREVDGDGLLPDLEWGLEERHLAFHAGVVDHYVEATEGVGGLLDQGLHLLRVGDVGSYHQPLASRVFDLLDHLLGRVGMVRVVDDHGGTLPGEGARYRFPYPRGRSRDHGHLVLEPHAGLLVFFLRQHVYE